MSPRHTEVRRNLIGRLARSRDFSISLILHFILVLSFGTKILFETVKEPLEIASESNQLYVPQAESAPRPTDDPATPRLPDILTPPSSTSPVPEITTLMDQSRDSLAPQVPQFVQHRDVQPPALRQPAPPAPPAGPEKLSLEAAKAIETFSKPWTTKGVGSVKPEYHFTAYLGQYAKGDWDSTNLITNSRVENGSLPNLLYFMSAFSNSRVKTNYQNVEVIRLDSDELFTVKPPFIFLTGTRDFELTPREVENLRTYLNLGGAIWGDSSVPGKNSRFDIAFRREMRRVIPDVNKHWEPLSPGHPIFTKAFFPEIRDVPPGLNSYREPVEVLRMFGEIAVVYTANDYGNMWQIGLEQQGQIDLRKNEKNAYVAISDVIWKNRQTYLRNITPESLATTYKFGTNIVIHLLTRWENIRTRINQL